MGYRGWPEDDLVVSSVLPTFAQFWGSRILPGSASLLLGSVWSAA